MISAITVIKPNEQSANVANLHVALRALGLTVDPAEVKDRRAGESTTKLVRQLQQQVGLAPQPDYVVDEATAAALNRLLSTRGLLSSESDASYQVYGSVTGLNGQPARGVRLAAFDQAMRSRQALGQTTTDADGKYKINYSAAQFQRGESGGPDLVIEAYGQSGEVLKTTDVLFNASTLASINVTLDQRGSEAGYDRIVRLLTPLLDGQGVTLDTLEENAKNQDISFGAGETGVSHDELVDFAVARRLPPATGLPAEFWFAVLATKAIVPPTPPDNSAGIAELATGVIAEISLTPVAGIENGLRKALAANLIAKKFEENVQQWLQLYLQLLTREALKEGSSSSAQNILAGSAVPDAKRNTLLQAYLQGGSRDDILQRVRDSKQFTDQEVNAIGATLVVNDLTLGDGKLLLEFRKSIADPSKASTIARISQADWVATIARVGAVPPDFVAGDTPEAKRNNYAALLTKRAAVAYPTATFAGELARAIDAKASSAIPNAGQVLSFLDAHPDFELATTSVDGYMKQRARPEFFNANNKTDFVSGLKATQRVFKVAPNFAATNTLLQDDLHSAQKIYRMGQTQFVQKYASKPGFTQKMATDAFQRAAKTHAAVITVVGELRATMNANKVQGLANSVPALHDFPNLANLFGNADSCDCDECQSIFGAAAYLADLLHYLEGRLLIPPTGTVKDILFGRRPDIGYIELTCQNSNTPLPYIDLACEIMEDHVAPWKLFDLPLALIPDFVEGPPDANIKNAFAIAATPIVLSDNARVSSQDQFNSWVIHDVPQSYRVQQQAGGLAVSILRQTHGTQEELAANPEYVNDAAYVALGKAVAPLALPFDLFTEEVRAYLSRVSLQRADLMTVYRGPNAPNNPKDLDIAAEYLGMTQTEQTLILQPDPANQFLYWGKPWGDNDNATTLASMSKVNIFLDRSGLEFADLQRMLTLSFVNPNGAIVIQSLDSSCDTSQKLLPVLDTNALDRIHRFLRLWRKLGWNMWEVDLVIQHAAIGNGKLDDLILKLYPFVQIKDKLSSLSVEQLCSFFGDINTNSKFTVAYQKPALSLYENLFLNKRLTNPVDPAFAISAVTAANPAALLTDSAHIAPILAATKLKQTELTIIEQLTKPGNGSTYLTDSKLSLKNLSFLYRHALLARTLRIKVQDWQTLLFLSQQDPFKDPSSALAFLKLVDRIQASGFSIDQLDYVLSANLSAKSAAAEKTITPVLTALAKSLQAIAKAYDPSTFPSSVGDLTTAIGTQLQTLGWDAGSIRALIATFSDQVQLQRSFKTAPVGFDFPPNITNQMKIGYDKNAKTISFTGVMTDARQNILLNDASLAAVTGNPDYQRAINDIHDMPRLLMKFYLPYFTAQLASLPSAVQFSSLASKDLTPKVNYDPILQQLTFFGIMSTDDQDALNALSPDAGYRGAVQSLFNQPRAAVPPSPELWLAFATLLQPLANNLAANLLTAERGLAKYVQQKLSTDQVIQQLSLALGLTQAVTENLMTTFKIFAVPPPKHALLPDFLDRSFINASSAITSAAFPEIYQGYFWLHRVALVIKTLGIAYGDLFWAESNAVATGVLDLNLLPLEVSAVVGTKAPAGSASLVLQNVPANFPPNGTVTLIGTQSVKLGYALAGNTLNLSSPLPQNVGDVAVGTTVTTIPVSAVPMLSLLNLAEFMQFHHTYSDDNVSLLAVLNRLTTDATYTSAWFGADVESLTGWTSSDVQALTAANAISLTFPADYTKVDAWQRLKKCFSILQRANASATSAMALATPVLSAANSASLKQMLRSKYDEETWLGISKAIQDDLRQRKRDSLVAYLLAQPMPADAPTGKWNDPEDLFAYYLIDVEMCSCQPTSRIVQASAAVQLLVQRCFMGLEPQVRVSVDLDSGWSEWAWMKYYRVWEANRRVFAYPENYAEPELRKDKSELFENLETELQQNEVTRDNVETAFIHYLEGLDGIAQLEIAGTFYQESTQTLHVIGRTAGGDPRVHYYRQLIAGRRWTAWSKVDTDIKADYVVPLVANERLHLVWPEMRSAATAPSSLPVPSSASQGSYTTVDPPSKARSMYLAVTEFKSGKWTPKKVSETAIELGKWTDDPTFTNGFHPERYLVIPVDLTWLPDFLFPPGKPRPKVPQGYEWLLDGPFLLQAYYIRPSGAAYYGDYGGPFELAGCKGVPEHFRGTVPLRPNITRFERDDVEDSRNTETSDAALDVLTPKANTSLILHQEILGNTPDRFKIYYPHYLSFIDRLIFVYMLILAFAQEGGIRINERGIPLALGTFLDWFYADKLRTFFVRPELYSRISPEHQTVLFYEDLENLVQEFIDLIAQKKYADAFKLILPFFQGEFKFGLRFFNFYHPLTCLFAKSLYQKGVEGLMARETQFADRKLDFKGQYEPTPIVDPNYPQEVVDFDPNGSYSLYNWELFFHGPLMVAERLSQNQQFEDAMRWFHFIFDPTGSHDVDPITGNPATAPQKYWITKPFYLRQQGGPNGYLQQRLENLMNLLASDPTNPSPNPMVLAIEQQVDDWRKNPFDPHLVAQYRTVAYQKLTVMKYIDNIIAWGDQLFKMDTLESVNAATQLYVVAAEIMGQAPRKIPPPARPVPQTFNELDLKLDALSNALVDFENLIPPMSSAGGGGAPAPPVPSLLYFCIPQNDKLAGYWATIEDRLYKIRHCLNIEGLFNPPSLFAPPIDPLALVKAAAAGLDLSTALSDLDAPLPFYRFSTMVQKANEFTNDVKALGAALLGALEKKDAEALALLRQGQEIALLQAVRDVKQKQADDAQLVIDGLQKNKDMVTIRRDYYASREFMNAAEIVAMALSGASTLLDAGIAVGYILAGGLKLIPEFVAGAAGFGGSPTVEVQEGGDNIGNAADDAVKTLSAIATALDKGASIASTVAGYQRRMDDWQNQLNLANKELEQLDKQIASAQKKLDIAQNELANQDLQIGNAQAIDQFMHSKYTNEDLYDWMVGQISQTYFQSYQLAFDLAKRAERCFRYEIGVEDTSYIQFGYWDSLKKGLQAGERLQLDLRRLESAYLDQNRREFECTKHISLAMLNATALVTLKDKGITSFNVPEELFDLDYPGHYFRRIKSVSVSIPCVAGPRTTVNATLRLLKNMVRINSLLTGQDPQNPYLHNHDDSGAYTDDDRFRESNLRVNAIATSSGQNDSGMFELNFRDDRYLPFEGAGAISTWQLELTQDSELRQFSYDTISDVILHVKYTSREDTGQFRDAAVTHLKADVLSQISSYFPLRRLFDPMHEFPTEWYAFLHPPAGSQETLQLSIRRQHFPYVAPEKGIQLEAVWLFVRTRPAIATLAAQLDPTTNGVSVYKIAFPPADANGFFTASQGGLGFLLDETQPFLLQLGTQQGQFNTLADGDILDCYIVVEYTLQ